MKLLIIDRDSLATTLLQSRLETRNYEITVEPSKNDALELLKTQDFDVIMFDPAPIQDARTIVINIYKTLKGRYEPQFLILSKTLSSADAIAAGANDLVRKPISSQDLEEKLDNLDRLTGYIDNLAIVQDLSSQKGIINKQAFNELFLSAIDRAHRYAERSFIVFISITAQDDDFNRLCNKLRYIRRQSDVIGQTGAHEFGILLQRPQYESEPHDATTRFTETLNQYVSEEDGFDSFEINLNLVEIPIGKSHIHTQITPDLVSVIHTAEEI